MSSVPQEGVDHERNTRKTPRESGCCVRSEMYPTGGRDGVNGDQSGNFPYRTEMAPMNLEGDEPYEKGGLRVYGRGGEGTRKRITVELSRTELVGRFLHETV